MATLLRCTSCCSLGAARPSRANGHRRRVALGAPRSQSSDLYPGYKEEKTVSHEAFMHAFEAAKPDTARIPGLQEFAAAIWDRRRRIPSTSYNDPLDHIFNEFDEDGDGHLTAAEVAKALQSRNVQASEKVVQAYISAVDLNQNGTIERNEFPAFVFNMASAELRSTSSLASADAA